MPAANPKSAQIGVATPQVSAACAAEAVARAASASTRPEIALPREVFVIVHLTVRIGDRPRSGHAVEAFDATKVVISVEELRE